MDPLDTLTEPTEAHMPKLWFLVDWECCLGAGGEGEVYLGRSVETGDLCAVKVSAVLDRAEAAEQLRTELDRCRRVAGDGAVGLIAWNLEAPRPFIAFELAHAGTLADEMNSIKTRGETYHPASALERIRGVLLALAHVHDCGLIHRDVKPANLLRFGDRIKLADFGTGLSDPKATPRSHTRSSSTFGPLESDVFVGTRLYAAPEQSVNAAADRRSDLYSVGCILYEMLTGAVPKREGATAFTDGYPSALVLPELDQLLRELLARDPEQRPVTAEQALRRVEAVQDSYRHIREVWDALALGPCPY